MDRFVPSSNGYELAWEDQFNGDQLDSGNWSVRGTGPRALGYVSAEAVKVKNGYLTLSAIKKRDSGVEGPGGKHPGLALTFLAKGPSLRSFRRR